MSRTDLVIPGIARQELLVGRYLTHGIERALGLRHPYLLHLPVLHINAEFGCLGIVQANERAVGTILRVIDDEHVINGPCLVDVTIYEVGKHLLRRYLVIADGVAELFDGEGIADDMGMIDHRVLHEHVYPVARQLLGVVPHDGIAVHRHAGVLGVIDQGVADRLHVDAVGTDMVVGMHLSIDGVGVDVEGEDLERVGMHEQGVALREVNDHGAVGEQGIARLLVVLTVVARHAVLIDGVGIDDIAEGLVQSALTVVIDAVADELSALVVQDRAVHEPCTFELRVIVALLGVDMAVAGDDVGGADDMGHGEARVVIERVGGQIKVLVAHLHVVVEDRHLRLRVILAPVGRQRGALVHHLASFEEIGIVVEAVEVQRVGIERRLAVLQHHVIACLRHLVVTIVVGVVGEERERVALVYLNMSEGLEGVGLLVEVGAVAVEAGADVGEVDVAVQNLCIAVLVLVVVQPVGMHEIDPLVLRLCRTASPFLGSKGKGADTECQHTEQQQIDCLPQLLTLNF